MLLSWIATGSSKPAAAVCLRQLSPASATFLCLPPDLPPHPTPPNPSPAQFGYPEYHTATSWEWQAFREGDDPATATPAASGTEPSPAGTTTRLIDVNLGTLSGRLFVRVRAVSDQGESEWTGASNVFAAGAGRLGRAAGALAWGRRRGAALPGARSTRQPASFACTLP